MNLFCDFPVNGLCSRYTGGGRCDKHIGKQEKPKREKQKKFRGESQWQKDNGMFIQK